MRRKKKFQVIPKSKDIALEFKYKINFHSHKDFVSLDFEFQ